MADCVILCSVEALIQSSRALCRRVERMRFDPPVVCVYNPLRYARDRWEDYLSRFARSGVEAVLLGMNPGPFGMAQTGVPFGEVAAARDWLGLEGAVKRPAKEHPARPVLGFDCPRSEVSGRRLWSWAEKRFSSPDRFFERFFVFNYCPLLFLEQTGRNRTPDKLRSGEQADLFEACDRALQQAVDALRPRVVVGIGRFAEKRAAFALAGHTVRVGGMLHPSPANPRANQSWARQAERQLAALGISLWAG
ncbi:MAG: single-stranded DNA-binding protein [Deltaproteobacteria bacterium]|nr:single-stranded DNA-binding protein [Deltaproteobacteria bacterium]